MVLRYCPSSQFGSYQGGFRIVRPTTTGVAISVVPLMFRLGTAKYVHAVIVGGDRTGAVPRRSGSAASPRAAPARAGTREVPALVYCAHPPPLCHARPPAVLWDCPPAGMVGAGRPGDTRGETRAGPRPTSRFGCSAKMGRSSSTT